MGFDIFAGTYFDAPALAAGARINPSAITVTAWIKEDAAANSGSIVNLRTPANTSGFTIEPLFGTPGVLLWAVHTANGDQVLTAPYGSVGETVFVAATFNSVEKRMALYLNGGLTSSVATSDATDCRILATETLRVGRSMVNALAFDGFIDDVQIYGDALSCRAIEWMFAHPGEAVATDTPPDLTGDGTINASDLAFLLGA